MDFGVQFLIRYVILLLQENSTTTPHSRQGDLGIRVDFHHQDSSILEGSAHAFPAGGHANAGDGTSHAVAASLLCVGAISLLRMHQYSCSV